jgi:hypothetical protein
MTGEKGRESMEVEKQVRKLGRRNSAKKADGTNLISCADNQAVDMVATPFTHCHDGISGPTR